MIAFRANLLARARSEPAPAGADTTLVDRIRQGDDGAFEELYRRYWLRLYGFCLRYVHSADEAADVVQEVFFRIWRVHPEWRLIGSLDRYLHQAVRNGAFDRLERAAVVERWRRGVSGDPAAMAHVEASADEVLQAGELAATVERALASMPEKRRAICALRWTDGLTYGEIADRLGITEKTVENQIGRGLRLLKERVADLER